jgi:hypothetical protein
MAQFVLEGAPGVAGKFVSLGIAGTLSPLAGASTGRGELDVGAVAGVDAPDLVFPFDEPSSLETELVESEAQVEEFRRLVMTTSSMAMSIQTAAVTTVIRVKVSPALVPKALEPPTPPKAPASPPPLPRWIRIRQIRKIEARMINVLKIVVKMLTI